MNRPIVFAHSHLPTLQSQAYFIRDKLIDAHLIYESDIGKAKWLSIFAKALNYNDWSHLSNKANDYKLNTNTVIFSDQTIEPIVGKLKAQLFRNDLDASFIRDIILNACTENELELLRTYPHSIPPLPFPPESYIVELGPKSKYAKNLLEWLWPRERIDIKRLHTLYHDHVKAARKGLSKAEVKTRHLDVYPKSGVQVEMILLELVEQGYCILDSEQSRVSLTERGSEYVASMLTDDYDEEWQQWWSVFLSYFEQIPYKHIDSSWNQYIKLYSQNIPPADAAKIFEWDSFNCDSDNQIRDAIKRQLGIELSEFPMERIFLFTPHVYFTPDLKNLPLSDIVFEFDGPEWAKPSKNLKVNRFWPNRSYVGAFLEGESIRGWVGLIPDDVDSFDVTYHWRSKTAAFKPIAHSFTYTLKQNRKLQVDWLYGDEASKINRYNEYSFNSLYCLTHGKEMTERELIQIPRIQAGITYLESNAEGFFISEKRTLIASNGFNCFSLF